MELDQPNSGARCGASQQVVIPPLPREDVKGGFLTPAALPPAMIVIVLPLLGLLPLAVILSGKLPLKDCVPSEGQFHLCSRYIQVFHADHFLLTRNQAG